MSFKQAYYTSCEEGLGGRKGFQFKAATGNFEPLLLSQIERLGLYVPPLSSPSRPTSEELEQFPLSLAFQLLGDGMAVLRQSKYLGLDYTGRYGNFIAHSLLTQDPYTDFCENNQLLPIETWRSDIWTVAEGDDSELPVVETVVSGKDIDYQSVVAFLQDPAHREIFPKFLTAVVEAIGTNRRVVLVDDNESIAFWIAAVSYALPHRFVMKLTFNTYVRDPYQSEALITGTTSDTTFSFASHEIDHQFFVFDFKGSRFTAIERPSGFAAKVAFAYRSNFALPQFASFSEAAAPTLSLEELEDAFAACCYFENLDLPDVNTVGVLTWSARYVKGLRAKDFQSLLHKVMAPTPVEANTLRAVTDFYLAALDSVDAPAIDQFRDIYFQWLISEAIRTAEVATLAETANKLPRQVYQNQHAEGLREQWLKILRDCDRPARFAAALLVGDKLGFSESESDVLTWLGTNASERWGADRDVQRAVCEVATRAGGKNVIEGIATDLAGKVNDVNLFSAFSMILENQNASAVMLNHAVKSQNIPLYLRLRGTQANLDSRKPERPLVLTTLLSDVRRVFEMDITPEIMQAAFSSVWIDSMPTMAEAQTLLSPPLFELVKNTDVPRQLVDLLGKSGGRICDSASEVELLNKLLNRDLLESLGDKTATVTGYAMASELQRGFIDPEGARIVEYLNWLAKASPRIPGLAPKLYELLGEKSVHVRDVQVHVRLLSEHLRRGDRTFLSGYDQECKSVLKKKKNNAEVYLLIKVWMKIMVADDRLLSRFLSDWIDLIEQHRSKRGLAEIEQSLASEPKLYRMWLISREARRKSRPSLWGRISGSVFGR